MSEGPILVAVAWPYVNGDIHVGHLAGYLLPADAFARWARLQGNEVLMVSGADCHGTPITVEAEKRNISPNELVKTYLPRLHKLISLYQLSYDLFTSTKTKNHYQVTQDFFLNLLKNGYILKKKSLQYYSPTQKRFLPDRYVEGECPYCHSKNQRADQCEVCGRILEPGELINPISKLDNQKVVLKSSEHYYLDYSKLAPQILDFVHRSTHWKEWVKQETLGWLKEGLQPRPITRDLEWGIPLPTEKIPTSMRLENINQKRFYVWFEAVIGYVSATKEYSQKQNTPSLFEHYWFNPNSKHYYFMGQDNLAFHTIFWPGELIGQKKGYTLPYQECINKFLTLEGKKFSKSRGIIIDSIGVGEKYGPDIVRFYLYSILPENRESSWYWDEFVKTINNILVDNIANLIQRIIVFQERFFDSRPLIQKTEIDPKIVSKTKSTFEKVNKNFLNCSLNQAFREIIEYASFSNNYLNQEEPWKKIKTNPKEAKKTIHNALYLGSNLSLLFAPFLPSLSQKFAAAFGLPLPRPLLNKSNYLPLQLPLELKSNSNLFPLVKKIALNKKS